MSYRSSCCMFDVERSPWKGWDVMEPTDPERVAMAWSLRTHQGMSYGAIAERLQVSKSTAHRWVAEGSDALEQGATPDRHAQRARDVATVDAWLERGEQLYADGELDYYAGVRAVVALLQHRARLQGLYAPVRVQTEDPKRPPDPELVAALQAEAARAQALDDAELERVLADDRA